MAKVLCSYSGLEFKVQHFPLYACANESHHPIFDQPLTSLTHYYNSYYLDGKLTEEESYLLYLSLFKHTNLIHFRVAAIRTQDTSSIIANNIHSLLQMVTRIDTIGHQKVTEVLTLPQYVITPDTRDLSCTHDWISIWTENYNDYRNGYRNQILADKIAHKEEMLEKHIKNKVKDTSAYASLLADWASLAGSFPDIPAGLDKSIFGGESMPLAEYWKRLIKLAARDDGMYSIPTPDILELIEHCEDNIEHGTIQAATLMAVLRNSLDKKNNFLSLGDIDITKTFKILKPDEGVEEANMLALILSAPRSEPKESQYPNKLAYIKAKLKYQQAQEYWKEHPTEHPDYVASELRRESDTADTTGATTDTIVVHNRREGDVS